MVTFAGMTASIVCGQGITVFQVTPDNRSHRINNILKFDWYWPVNFIFSKEFMTIRAVVTPYCIAMKIRIPVH